MPTFSEHLLEDEPEEQEEPEPQYTYLDSIVIGFIGTNDYIQYLGDVSKVDDICQKHKIKDYEWFKRRQYESFMARDRRYTNRIGLIDIDNGYRYEKF